MSALRLAAVALLGLSLAGCAQSSLGGHQASLQSLELLRDSSVPPMRVDHFTLAPGKPADLDSSVTVRSVVLSSPDHGSMAEYLQKTLETDLRAAGKLDPNSTLVVTGLLTDSDVSSGLPTGSASLGARFSLIRDGKTVFDKQLTAQAQWTSSFLGAVAIPDAVNQYSALFDKLVVELLSDADFKLALAPPHGP